jgi:ribosomal protein S15P/S13E
MLGGKAKSNEKTPPADVPEYEILQLLQKQRRRLVKYLKE